MIIIVVQLVTMKHSKSIEEVQSPNSKFMGLSGLILILKKIQFLYSIFIFLSKIKQNTFFTYSASTIFLQIYFEIYSQRQRSST